MCAIFGFVNYGHALSGRHLKELVNKLAVESEVRGTDATGIAYVKNGALKIYKKPRPAHKVRLYFPDDTTILTGHTRMTTQGNAKYNYNNHPFAGHTVDGDFALCHNGVLYNDDTLQKSEELPKTHIKTDSYVAAQLIEKYGKLNFDTIAKMCETVKGNFVFTMLNDDNTLYLAKGDNPLCLVHFKQLGLFLYTSTKAIMESVITETFLKIYAFETIKVDEGEMICINKDGNLTRDTFVFDDYIGHLRYYGGYEEQVFHSDYLYEMCNLFGLTTDDISLLYEMGYCDEEIELMLEDREYLQVCLEDARSFYGENLMEESYGVQV